MLYNIITTLLAAFLISLCLYGCAVDSTETKEAGNRKSDRVSDTTYSQPDAEMNIVLRTLSAPAIYPFAGFDPDAQLQDRRLPPGRDFMLVDDPWYSRMYDSMKVGTGYDSLRRLLVRDSSEIIRQYSSAVMIHSNGQLFGPQYSFHAALFFNDSNGVLYWAGDDKNESVAKKAVPKNIIRYVDTVLALQPGSHEELAADGDRIRFITFISPQGNRNMIYGVDLGYDNFDYDSNPVMFRDMPRKRFDGRKYLDSLISSVAALGDPVGYGSSK